MATQKQIDYANAILKWLDERGLLADAITELKPDLRENEDIAEWFKRLSTVKMSEVITSLTETLNNGSQ